MKSIKSIKPKVLVGMSGGVDSSVSAALLVREGYDVVGGFIKNWSDSKDLWTGECAWRGERRDAMRVAAKLGIPLLTFDFEKEYRAAVVDELFRGYEAGETPNPDVLCNEFIKFGLFFEEAMRLGFDFVATGHYARTESGKRLVPPPISLRSNIARFLEKLANPVRAAEIGGGTSAMGSAVRLLRGTDPSKDQSYFLYRVPQNVLRRTMFPIGHLRKSEVRDLAREFSLPVAEKPDSQGICFIGKLDMVEFLRKKIPSKPGEIVDENGNILGRHEGLDGYTIGQRERINVESPSRPSSRSEPWFVAEKDMKLNRLIVIQGENHSRLFRREATVRDLHWTSGEEPPFPFGCDAQVRYRQEPTKAKVESLKSKVAVTFHTPVKAVAAGQSAVFYQGEECLGGGIIAS